MHTVHVTQLRWSMTMRQWAMDYTLCGETMKNGTGNEHRAIYAPNKTTRTLQLSPSWKQEGKKSSNDVHFSNQ